ncbi:MAG TPA: menaquinone biosynthesis protein [Blastocatellia bacterium]|nr:menaquinone biosynthesis protein [Blastocatellia bacterium]
MTPRIAASTYLNSAPLVYALTEGTQRALCRLAPDPAPSTCARMLSEGSADIALVPSIEAQRIAGTVVMHDVCVAARSSVRSVLLVSRRELGAIGSIALDDQSRTSAALVRILMPRLAGVRPRYMPAAPDLGAMLENNDAALIIGDPAMAADTTGLHVFDLAALWREYANLPFVFALWAGRPERLEDSHVDFESARDEGVRAIPAIARRYASVLGRPESDLVDYLTSSIHYHLDAESLAGLELFYRLAHEEGLIDPPRALEFWPTR